MFQTIAIAVLILYVAIAWVIFRDYRHTRNIGFLIIGCGVLVWPLVGGFVMRMVTQSVLDGGRHVTDGWIVLLSTYSYKVIHAALMLIGFIAIGRSINVTPRIAGNQR
jgi:hypothetical protein